MWSGLALGQLMDGTRGQISPHLRVPECEPTTVGPRPGSWHLDRPCYVGPMPTPTIAPKMLSLAPGRTSRSVNPSVEAIKAMSDEDFRRELIARRGGASREREAAQRTRAQTAAAAKAARLASLSR